MLFISLLDDQGFSLLLDCKYNSSTLLLAQGVFLKNVKLDLIEGLLVKHRIGI